MLCHGQIVLNVNNLKIEYFYFEQSKHSVIFAMYYSKPRL